MILVSWPVASRVPGMPGSPGPGDAGSEVEAAAAGRVRDRAGDALPKKPRKLSSNQAKEQKL